MWEEERLDFSVKHQKGGQHLAGQRELKEHFCLKKCE